MDLYMVADEILVYLNANHAFLNDKKKNNSEVKMQKELWP